jgi:hypothetical protein
MVLPEPNYVSQKKFMIAVLSFLLLASVSLLVEVVLILPQFQIICRTTK